jgi:hypothetical protein
MYIQYKKLRPDYTVETRSHYTVTLSRRVHTLWSLPRLDTWSSTCYVSQTITILILHKLSTTIYTKKDAFARIRTLIFFKDALCGMGGGKYKSCNMISNPPSHNQFSDWLFYVVRGKVWALKLSLGLDCYTVWRQGLCDCGGNNFCKWLQQDWEKREKWRQWEMACQSGE